LELRRELIRLAKSDSALATNPDSTAVVGGAGCVVVGEVGFGDDVSGADEGAEVVGAAVVVVVVATTSAVASSMSSVSSSNEVAASPETTTSEKSVRVVVGASRACSDLTWGGSTGASPKARNADVPRRRRAIASASRRR
jgi:hypothetical protein